MCTAMTCACIAELILAVSLPQFGFKKNNLRSGVEDILAYLERCRISEMAGATQPLALEVDPNL
jgi:hypothetical protein